MIIVAFIIFMEILLQSLKLGIAPSIVVAVYLLINKIIEDRKESKQAKLNSQVIESFAKLNNFLDYFTKNIINKEVDKCEVGIRHSFDKLKSTLLQESIIIIINNNIVANKKNIITNIQHLINGEYYVLKNNLKLYTTHFVNISDFISEEWKQELYDDIVNIIFNVEFTKDQKIYSLQTKLDSVINEYKNIVLSSNLNKLNDGTDR